jgi:hypothetical protein
MIPRKLHIEQINRFHDKFKEISDKIEENKGEGFVEDNYELLKQYMEMTEIWTKIDDICEMDIKNYIDIIECS